MAAIVRIGRSGPFGRQSIVSALPINEPPRWIVPPRVVMDSKTNYPSDQTQDLIGRNGLWCNRILYAAVVEDTRRM